MPSSDLPIRAAEEIAATHGIVPDRCDVLQDGHTLVLRLTGSLVARVVADSDGPRQGSGWYSREIAVAEHLARLGAPVIPVHPQLPPGPYEHLGYTLNFWQYVTTVDQEPEPAAVGHTLFHCHHVLRSFMDPLPALGIPTETRALLETLDPHGMFDDAAVILLKDRLACSLEALRSFPMQPLHGDAHPGNLLNTTQGLLWTDWEDTFSGPVEWDLASIIWNARILEEDHATADGILAAYREAGGSVDESALHHSMVARAAVMSAWYPILYPDAGPARLEKLARRLDFLRE